MTCIRMTGICSFAHKNGLLSDLAAIRHDKTFCDILLIAGDNVRVAAHRVVLMASSRYFRAILKDEMANSSNEQEIALNKFDGVTIEAIVDFLYSGRVDIKSENIEMLFQAAAYFEIDQLTKGLAEFIDANMNLWNWTFFRDMFARYNYEDLVDNTQRFIWNHIDEISKTSDFFKLNFNDMSKLMQSDHLNISSEMKLFFCLKKWIEHDEHREFHLHTLLPLLRLSQMSPEFIVENIQPMCKCDKFNQLIDSTLKWLQLNAKDRKIANDLPSNWMIKRQCEKRLIIVVDSNVQEYCFEERNWKNLTRIPNGHSMSTAVILNGDLFIIGGTLNGPRSHRFNFKSKKWTKVAGMNSFNLNPALASFNDEIYAVCGIRDIPNESTFGRAIYSPVTNEWKRLIKMRTSQHSVELVSNDRYIYCLDGYSGNSLRNEMMTNEEINVSLSRRSLITPRKKFGVAFDNNEFFIVGGGTNRVERATIGGVSICQVVEESCTVQKCVVFQNKVLAFGNKVVFECDVEQNRWYRSTLIKPVAGCNFRGAFAVNSYFFNELEDFNY